MPARNDFDAKAMFAAMDARRMELGLTWAGVARAIWNQSAALNARRPAHPISPATLTGFGKRGDCTGIRTARYAIGMRLMMRIVCWLGVPRATFIYAAGW